MPSRTNTSTSLRAAVSVSQMARMLGLSRAAFYSHIKKGDFVAPVYSLATRRPVYTAELQSLNLEVRATQVGVNGEFVLFYERQQREQSEERARQRRRSANAGTLA